MAIGTKKTVFQTLSEINVSHMTEKKGNFTYLSWTHAWKAVKDNYPNATFVKTIYEDNQNNQLPFMRDTKGNTWVGVSVLIEGICIEEIFPVLDIRNKAMTFPDAFSVNTAHQRCLTKALAYHGLGINVYAGEDLPMASTNSKLLEEYQEKADVFKRKIKNVTKAIDLAKLGDEISAAKLPDSFADSVRAAFSNKSRQLKGK